MAELAHHGILGMKWGIRRFQNADGTLTAAGRKRYDKEPKKAGKQQKNTGKQNVKNALGKATNNPKLMSNEELQARIQRIQLEKQYAELTKKEVPAGVKFVNGILTDTASSVAKKQLGAFANNQIKKLVDKKLGMDEERKAEKNRFTNQTMSENEYKKENAAFDNVIRKASEYAYNYARKKASFAANPTYSSTGSDFVDAIFNGSGGYTSGFTTMPVGFLSSGAAYATERLLLGPG